ncbi:Smr domain-containing protein [Sphaceloma murrayae]|uniref:Smr domain-containing protein n=1 Tax=Sphaceloma murrayae TaxID=2082308 RepID=A0A2K1R3B0_9PEZI|nr:Smr domain-containing protein [Sphaceloma murrayae]
MDEQIAKLEAEYCPPLDTAVFLAIISDYDVEQEASLAQARATLDLIKDSAEAEQAASDFAEVATGEDSLRKIADPDSSERTFRSGETGDTSLSNGLSRLEIASGSDDATERPGDANPYSNLDVETKVELLTSLVPEVSSYTIRHTLSKCELNLHRALDELLNISALHDAVGSDGEGIPRKGVDAFSEDLIGKRGRKKKRKGGHNRQQPDEPRASSLPHDQTRPVVEAWKSADRDVEFLVNHTKLSSKTVQAAYNANGASIPKTITHLLDDMVRSASRITSSNPTVQANAVDLGRDFPSISPAYLAALIQLTHPSTSSAHVLARAMTARPISSTTGPIIPHYKSLSLSDDESSSISSPTTITSQNDHATTKALALSHSDAHRLLSSQAAAAYRRSRSNHLYGGAAAYYADRAREQAASASAYSSAAADAQVAAQSTGDQLDLHGAIVADAVRIAKRETAAWWTGLGEARFSGRTGAVERERGYRIVVGLGRHSEGGRSKIGPAVYKALVGEGWKVDGGQGVLTVRGKAR